MGITLPGLMQGLNAGAEGLSQGYYGAIGTAIQRNLAQQKQTSETNLQGAQAGYFDNRNPTALQVATTRAGAVNEAALTRANGVDEAARINALSKMPANFGLLSQQNPDAAAAWVKSVDATNNGQTSFYKTLFPSRYAAENAPPGGPGQPYLNPADPSAIQYGPPAAPTGGIGTLGTLGLSSPPAAAPDAAPALPVPPRVFSAPAVSPGTPAIVGGGGNAPSVPNAPSLPAGGPLTAPGGYVPPAAPTAPATASGDNPFNPGATQILQTARANNLNANTIFTNGARTTHLGAVDANLKNKADIAFQNQVGILPLSQQGLATLRFNALNGTNYPVPGVSYPTLAGGQRAQGPPSVVPAYTPNLLQAATIANKNAQAGMDTSLGAAATGNLQVHQKTQAQQVLYDSGLLKLKAQGLADDEARAVMDNKYKMGMLDSGGNSTAGDALTMRLNQRMTALTAPGKPDYSGTPTAPMVTLDAQGNPSGPGAHEYHQIQGMLKARQPGMATGSGPARPVGVGGQSLAPLNPLSNGFSLRVGSQVPPGTHIPPAAPLPVAGQSANPYMNMTPQHLRALARQRGKI